MAQRHLSSREAWCRMRDLLEKMLVQNRGIEVEVKLVRKETEKGEQWLCSTKESVRAC